MIQCLVISLHKLADKLIVEYVGDIVTIGINRPQKRNAVDHSTAKELVRAFQDFESSKDAKVAVLHGTGVDFVAHKAFTLFNCSQHDLHE